jgi:outer membrane protein assembly factor BamB
MSIPGWRAKTRLCPVLDTQYIQNPAINNTKAPNRYELLGLKAPSLTYVCGCPPPIPVLPPIWPMLAYDAQHTGRCPYLGPQTTPTLIWNFFAVSITESPVIAGDGILYAGGSANGNIVAYNPTNGSSQVITQVGTGVRGSPAIGQDGTLYVYSFTRVYAFNTAGTSLWVSPSIGTSDGSVVINNTMVYIANSAGIVFAIRMSDGSIYWQYDTLGTIAGSVALASNGTLYVGSSYNLVALNPDGSLLWNTTFGNVTSGNMQTPSVGNDGYIYIGTDTGTLFKIDPVSAAHDWHTLLGIPVQGIPAIGSDGTIYIPTYDSTGTIFAELPNGTNKWTTSLGASIYGSVILGSDDTLYVVTYTPPSIVYALSPVDGSQKWSYTLTTSITPITGTPILGKDGTLYIGNNSGRLYALR